MSNNEVSINVCWHCLALHLQELLQTPAPHKLVQPASRPAWERHASPFGSLTSPEANKQHQVEKHNPDSSHASLVMHNHTTTAPWRPWSSDLWLPLDLWQNPQKRSTVDNWCTGSVIKYKKGQPQRQLRLYRSQVYTSGAQIDTSRIYKSMNNEDEITWTIKISAS